MLSIICSVLPQGNVGSSSLNVADPFWLSFYIAFRGGVGITPIALVAQSSVLTLLLS